MSQDGSERAAQIGQREIEAAIALYSARGWAWLDVVAFLAMKHTGRLDRYLNPHKKYASRLVGEADGLRGRA